MRGFRIILAVAVSIASPAAAGPVAPPIDATVVIRDSGEKLSGHVLEFDDQTFQIRVRGEARSIRWLDLTGRSAFALRKRLTDPKSAQDWLKLAELCWSLDVRDAARDAVKQAARLDPSTADRGRAILSVEPGMALRRGATQPVDGADSAASTAYIPATPEQSTDAVDRARRRAGQVSEQLKLKLREIETAHFIIFTDWAPGDDGFLRANLEAAYTAVARQFGLSPKDNIFVGKLPVYMFDRQDDFRRFAEQIDEAGALESALGYYRGNARGFGHMAMWKPDVAAAGGNLRAAQEKWARVLTHEFTHAFLHRYRSNRQVTRWLNEGVAEVISHGLFPEREFRGNARIIAARGDDLSGLFDDEQMPPGELYPVMETMVEMLLAIDRGKFIGMIDRIKDGVEPERAMVESFGMNHEKLIIEWRKYVARNP